MKRLMSIILLLSVLALSAIATDLRYGVAVWGQLPERANAMVERFAATTQKTADLLDYDLISHDIIDGNTITLDTLYGYKVLVLPSLHVIDEDALAILKSFVADGGKLIVCVDDKEENLPVSAVNFLNLVGISVSSSTGKTIKLQPGNSLWESDSTINLTSNLALKPQQNVETLAYFVDEKGKEIAPAAIKSANAIVFAGPVFNNWTDNEPLTDWLLEAFYQQGDDKLLVGFAPLGLDEWRPMVQTTKASVRRAKTTLRNLGKQFYVPDESVLEKYTIAEKASDLMDLAFKTGNALRIAPYYRIADSLAKEVMAMSQVVRKYEARAVWMDEITINRAGSPSALRETIRTFAEAGFNMILPEVVSHGATIFPTKVGIQNEKYTSWSEDPLKVIVEEAHKYGMEVHAWTWVFCAGYSHKFGPILEKHPEWAEQDEDGRVFSNWQYGTAWLNASMPEPRQYLKDLFMEIVTKYALDGLHLDYIRYNEDEIGHFGLSEFSRNAFKEKYGFDPKSVAVGSKEWKLFDQWREDNVTSFVKEMTEAVKKENPNLLISAAVVPDPNHSRTHVLQNWKNWADNKILDFILTMAYTSDNAQLKDRTIAGLTVTENKIWVYPGLGVYVNTSDNNMSQVQLTRNLGTTGVAMFSTIHLLKEQEKLDDLRVGPFREPAIIPQREPFKAMKGLITDAADTHSRAGREETAQKLHQLANSIADKPEKPIEVMENMATELNNYLEALLKERKNRDINILEYEALSGALSSAWRITQIYIYQNTERPFIMPNPR